jgi:hypothetical protein
MNGRQRTSPLKIISTSDFSIPSALVTGRNSGRKRCAVCHRRHFQQQQHLWRKENITVVVIYVWSNEIRGKFVVENKVQMSKKNILIIKLKAVGGNHRIVFFRITQSAMDL